MKSNQKENFKDIHRTQRKQTTSFIKLDEDYQNKDKHELKGIQEQEYKWEYEACISQQKARNDFILVIKYKDNCDFPRF